MLVDCGIVNLGILVNPAIGDILDMNVALTLRPVSPSGSPHESGLSASTFHSFQELLLADLTIVTIVSEAEEVLPVCVEEFLLFLGEVLLGKFFKLPDFDVTFTI